MRVRTRLHKTRAHAPQTVQRECWSRRIYARGPTETRMKDHVFTNHPVFIFFRRFLFLFFPSGDFITFAYERALRNAVRNIHNMLYAHTTVVVVVTIYPYVRPEWSRRVIADDGRRIARVQTHFGGGPLLPARPSLPIDFALFSSRPHQTSYTRLSPRCRTHAVLSSSSVSSGGVTRSRGRRR